VAFFSLSNLVVLGPQIRKLSNGSHWLEGGIRDWPCNLEVISDWLPMGRLRVIAV